MGFGVCRVFRKLSAILLTVALLGCPYLCGPGAVLLGAEDACCLPAAVELPACCESCAAEEEDSRSSEPTGRDGDSCGLDCLCKGAVQNPELTDDGEFFAPVFVPSPVAGISVTDVGAPVSLRGEHAECGRPSARMLRALLGCWVC